MENLNIPLVLNNGEFRQDLKSKTHSLIAIDCNVKTAFAVNKPYYPLYLQHDIQPERKVSEGSYKGVRPYKSSLRIVHISVGFLLPAQRTGEYRAALGVSRIWFSFTKACDPKEVSLLSVTRVNLRTVIVTAAVYRGFNSQLSPLLLTFRHRAGVRPYTSSCDFAEPYVFSKQSPPPIL